MIDAFRAVARHLPTPLVLVSLEGDIVAANLAAARLLGADEVPLEGRGLAQLFAGDVATYLATCARTTAPVPGAFVLGRDGKTRLSCEGARLHRDQPFVQLRLFEPGARAPFLLLRQKMEQLQLEIERRKRAEQTREALIAELQQAMRVSELFLGILGHDLRNPLSAIRMAAETIRRRGADEKTARGVERIITSADRMTRMIGQLLDVTRVRLGAGIPVEPEPTELCRIARRVLDELELAHPGGSVHLEIDGDTAGVWDPDRLEQVCSNLVTNALQHGEDGRVRVRVEGTPDAVRLLVQNRGVVPAQVLPSLFEPFERLEAPGQSHQKGHPKSPAKSRDGLGLGLYITRQIVLSHGGAIEARSSPEVGTEVEVVLPRGG